MNNQCNYNNYNNMGNYNYNNQEINSKKIVNRNKILLLTGAILILGVLLYSFMFGELKGNTTTKYITLVEKDTIKLDRTGYALDEELNYLNSNKDVVSVDEFGEVTAITKGKATVTLVSKKSSDTKYVIEVKSLNESVEVEEVKLNKEKINLKSGESSTITYEIEPKNATNQNVSWYSTNEDVAVVENGKIIAKGNGNATILVKSGNNKIAKTEVKIGEGALLEVINNGDEIFAESINVDKKNLTIIVGETVSLKEEISPSNTTNKNVNWTSSNPKVAIVDNNGKVAGVSKGLAIISVATNNNKTATSIITVDENKTSNENNNNSENKTNIEVVSITINSSSDTIEVGKSIILTSTLNPSNATNKSITWISNDSKVASVDNNGKVTGISKGTAIITATTSNNKIATFKVTVNSNNTNVVTNVDTSKLNLSFNLDSGIYDTCNDSNTDFYVCNNYKNINITSTNSSKIETIILKKSNGEYKSTNLGKITNGKSAVVSLEADGEYLVKAYPLDSNGNRGNLLEKEYVIFSDMYQNGVYSKNGIEIRWGVKGKTNFFEPNKNFTYYFKIKGGKSLNGKLVTNTISSKTSGVNISKTDSNWNNKQISISDNLEHLYTGTFNVSKNGVYTIKIKIDNITLGFDVGITPRNQTAIKSNFYYGVSPYLDRALTWSGDYRVQDQNKYKSVISIMETASYMGINLIREGRGWSSIQSDINSNSYDSSLEDKFLNIANKYGFTFLWTLGNKRSDVLYYKNEYLNKYKEFVNYIANKYAKNPNIIWEIWNEPDFKEFWGLGGTDANGSPKYNTYYGTKDQYLDFLKTAATTLKSVNPKAKVSAGGLAVYYPTSSSSVESQRAWHGEDIFKDYVKLLNDGVIDTYALHNHKLWDVNNFLATVNGFNDFAKNADLTRAGVYITESGVGEGNTQAYGLASKILWYRARGYKMFMQFSMLDYNTDSWNKAIFSRYLEPRDAAITYATVIRMIGQANYTQNIANDSSSGSIFADIYYQPSNNTSIIPVFSAYNGGKKLQIPSGAVVYDMYGNVKSISGNTIQASIEPIYVVVNGKADKSQFTVK